jgi:2-dehydro-3-deoxy-D-arabinonate dehydratase
MQLVKFAMAGESTPQAGLLQPEHVVPLATGPDALCRILHSGDIDGTIAEALAKEPRPIPLGSVCLLAPLDRQEVWGAGVTYARSKVAREQESKRAASFYDLVYTAARPELFFKATPSRVAGPGSPVRMRRDTNWCVPEPELALVLTPALALVGFTIGNDQSARDIEGENPLYLPQAKVYDACCALGPAITLAGSMPPRESIGIRLDIVRDGQSVFRGETSIGQMARSFESLIDWLGRDNIFPYGVFLLTGTGIIPPDSFCLEPGDLVEITIDGIGTLTNPVVQTGSA